MLIHYQTKQKLQGYGKRVNNLRTDGYSTPWSRYILVEQGMILKILRQQEI